MMDARTSQQRQGERQERDYMGETFDIILLVAMLVVCALLFGSIYVQWQRNRKAELAAKNAKTAEDTKKD
jgi:hypothetical protein